MRRAGTTAREVAPQRVSEVVRLRISAPCFVKGVTHSLLNGFLVIAAKNSSILHIIRHGGLGHCRINELAHRLLADFKVGTILYTELNQLLDFLESRAFHGK